MAKWTVNPDAVTKLVGRTIKEVFLDDEQDGYNSQVVILLDDNTVLFSWRDDEGNGPGRLIHADSMHTTHAYPCKVKET
jgi:hypothetical protein